MVGVEEPFIKDIRKKGTLTVFRVRMTSLLSEFILGRSALFVTFTADSRRLPTEFRLGTGIGPITGFIQDLEAAE
jgi:hypothetical protein